MQCPVCHSHNEAPNYCPHFESDGRLKDEYLDMALELWAGFGNEPEDPTTEDECPSEEQPVEE